MKYADIINMQRPVSKRKPMLIEERAAQFAPFAALSGHDGIIAETARITDKKILIDSNEKELINATLNEINKNISLKPQILITHFVKDKTKEGGTYIKTYGTIKKIDEITKVIILQNNTIIYIDDLFNIEILSKF